MFDDYYDVYGKSIIKVGFSEHDCDAYYECPYCKKAYSGWELFHRGVEEGAIFKCDDCGRLLKYN